MSTRTTAYLLGSSLILTLMASSAVGQVQRTFVSGLGNDGNPCSRTAPCRTFAQALMGTSAGGEVYVLDSAGYAPFNVTQSVSVVAPPGVVAGISVFSGDGITINAGVNDTIILRGLTLNNQGSTGRGVLFNTGGTLHVENCVVNGFSSASGLIFSNTASLEVKDSIFRGNLFGIEVFSGTAAIDNVRLERNISTGLAASDGSKVTVRNSLVSGGNTGFSGVSNSAQNAELNIENCFAFNNSNVGIQSTSSSTGVTTVRVSNSIVTDNGTGFFAGNAPAVFQSRGNNTVEGNTTNVVGAVGSYTAK
jgi:hypothetical protein